MVQMTQQMEPVVDGLRTKQVMKKNKIVSVAAAEAVAEEGEAIISNKSDVVGLRACHGLHKAVPEAVAGQIDFMNSNNADVMGLHACHRGDTAVLDAVADKFNSISSNNADVEAVSETIKNIISFDADVGGLSACHRLDTAVPEAVAEECKANKNKKADVVGLRAGQGGDTAALSSPQDISNSLAESCLQMIARLLGPEWDVQPFGSFANGFGTKSSDLDVTICKASQRVGEQRRKEAVEVLKWLISILRENEAFSDAKEVLSARVPIIKFRFEKELEVDISYNNFMPLFNTRLLKAYSTMDDRIRDLGVAIKTWAKEAGVCGASKKNLSSYAVTLLTIYFMQVHPKVELPVVPPDAFVDAGQKEADGRVIAAMNSWRCGLSVDELIHLFFAFYANIDSKGFVWGEEVVSVRSGRRLGRTHSLYYKLCGKDELRLHVEDPYQLERNLHCVLGPEEEWTLWGALREAASATETSQKAESSSSVASTHASARWGSQDFDVRDCSVDVVFGVVNGVVRSASDEESEVTKPDPKRFDDRIEAVNTKIKNLETEVQSICRKINKLSAIMDEYEARRAELLAEVDKWIPLIDEANGAKEFLKELQKLEHLEATLKGGGAASASRWEQIKDLREQITTYEKTKKEALEKVQELNEKRKMQTGDLFELTNQHDEICKEIGVLSKERNMLKEEKRAELSQVNSPEADLEGGGAASEPPSKQISEHLERIATYVESKEKAPEKVKEVNDERTKQTGDPTELINQRAEIGKRIGELIEECNRIKAEKGQAERKHFAAIGKLRRIAQERLIKEREARELELADFERITLIEQTITFCKSLGGIYYNNPEGTVVMLGKKDRDEDFFCAPTARSKKSKGNKAAAAASAPAKSTLEHTAETLDLFSKLELDAPHSTDDVPALLEKLAKEKAKVEEWKQSREEHVRVAPELRELEKGCFFGAVNLVSRKDLKVFDDRIEAVNTKIKDLQEERESISTTGSWRSGPKDESDEDAARCRPLGRKSADQLGEDGREAQPGEGISRIASRESWRSCARSGGAGRALTSSVKMGEKHNQARKR